MAKKPVHAFTNCPLDIAAPDSDLARECELRSGTYALVIGEVNNTAHVIKGGDLNELLEFGRRVRNLVLDRKYGEYPSLPTEVLDIVRSGREFTSVTEEIIDDERLTFATGELDNIMFAYLLQRLDDFVDTVAKVARHMADQAQQRGDKADEQGMTDVKSAVVQLESASVHLRGAAFSIDPTEEHTWHMIA